MTKNNIIPFIDVLGDLVTWFQETQTNAMVIGGVAVSLVAKPRTTQDIDALVLMDQIQWSSFLQKGKKFHFVPRIDDALEFAKKSRVLLMVHESSGIDIDLSFAALPFEEEALSRKVQATIGTVIVPLPSPEDLIIMKAVANRDKDLIDIASILETQKTVDKKHVDFWLKQFSEVLEDPEILKKWNSIYKSHS
jgi:hypothetical protein